ncbi:PAS domain S-box protein [Oligoflexia bacterium]|nr:PAS domain S-box protein [Oligoflexia bacterium]
MKRKDHDLHVLVVEVAMDCSSALHAILEGEHYHVVVSQSLEEAQAEIAQNLPDIVITDLCLPVGSGLDLLEWEGAYCFPVIVMVSPGEERTVVPAIKGGAFDFIVKSASAFTDLPRIIERTVREWEHICARRASERQLGLLASAVEQINEGIAVVDFEGNILSINRVFAEMHGYTSEELLGKHLSIFHAEEQLTSVNEANAAIKATGEFSGEVWHVHRSGKTFPVMMNNKLLRDEQGHAIGMIGTARDISEQKQTQKALQESESLLKSIMDHNPSVIYLKDMEGRYLLINRRFEELFHVTVEELKSKSDYDIFPKEIADVFRENDRAALESGTVLMIDEEVPQGDDVHTYLSIKFPIRNNKGVITAVAGVSTDITLRKEAEKKIAAHEARLRALGSRLSHAEEQERHRIATELHDRVTQNLNVANLKLGEFQELLGVSDRVGDLIQVRELLSEIIDDVQTLTYEIGSPILVHLGLTAALEWLGEKFEKRHYLPIMVVDDGLPKPIDDEHRAIIFQAVRELLNNCVKHAKADNVFVRLKREDTKVQVDVEDDGVGCDTSEIAFSVEKPGCFGLFNIRERVEYLGGKFQIQSQIGRGTKVILTVPAKVETMHREVIL